MTRAKRAIESESHCFSALADRQPKTAKSNVCVVSGNRSSRLWTRAHSSSEARLARSRLFALRQSADATQRASELAAGWSRSGCVCVQFCSLGAVALGRANKLARKSHATFAHRIGSDRIGSDRIHAVGRSQPTLTCASVFAVEFARKRERRKRARVYVRACK